MPHVLSMTFAETSEVAVEATNVLVAVLSVLGALVAAYILGTVVSGLVRRAGRRNAFVRDASSRVRRPLRALLMVAAVWIAVTLSTNPAMAWRPAVEHVMFIALIAVGSWFVGALAFVIEDSALKKFRMDVADNRHARRIRTQIIVVRRLTVALVVILGMAGVLFTFPAARAAGASLLASAGLISIVAGLAAQTTLANVFAGMQIAFTDAIRVDDVVVLEGEWGRIEEITMTYVVVHLWDDRRLIMPCTYFTTTPFQNWTRRAAELLGTVEIDLDWNVPLALMRAELARLLDATPLWDHRVGILQVTDATHGYVRVRALASAVDAGTLFDLRCYVREGLVDWLRTVAPEGVPRTRIAEASVGREQEGSEVGNVLGDAGRQGRIQHRRWGSDEAAVVPSVVAQPSAPPQVPVRVARPGRRKRVGVSTRGLRADVTTVLPGGSDPEATTMQVHGADATLRPLSGTDKGLFTGSAEAVERSKAFSGPGQDVIDERERTAEQEPAGPDRMDREP